MCDRFLISIFEAHSSTDAGTAAAAMRATLRFIGLGRIADQMRDHELAELTDLADLAGHAESRGRGAARPQQQQPPPRAAERPSLPQQLKGADASGSSNASSLHDARTGGMWPHTRARLTELFRPANTALARLLAERCRRVSLRGELSGASRGLTRGVARTARGGVLELPGEAPGVRWLLEGTTEAFRQEFVF